VLGVERVEFEPKIYLGLRKDDVLKKEHFQPSHEHLSKRMIAWSEKHMSVDVKEVHIYLCTFMKVIFKTNLSV
jgi:hypothetical protein